MITVKTRAEMRLQLKQYRAQAHATKKHIPATLALVQTLWNTSRRERKDVWELLSKHNAGKEKEPITASAIKKAFREFITVQQAERCCYCRQWLFRMAHAKPIEHVLPKITYPHYSLHFWNLAVACADCNRLKGDDVWGAFPPRRFSYPHPSEYTDMFHPRFHQYDEHVQFVHVATNRGSIALYKGLTPQGRHLCSELLHKVAAERMLLDADPALNSAVSEIENYRSQLAGSSPHLQTFMKTLDGALLRILE